MNVDLHYRHSLIQRRSALGALRLRGLPRRDFLIGVPHLSFQSLLCFEILGEILLSTNSNHQSGGLFLFIGSNIRYIFLYIETLSCFKRKNKDMIFQPTRQ